MFFESTRSDGVQESQSTKTVNIASVFSHFEGDLHMRLGAKIVNFGGLDLGDDVDKISAVAQISIVQFE